MRACACLFGFLHSRNDREKGKQYYGGGQVSTVREMTFLKSCAREEWGGMLVDLLTEDQKSAGPGAGSGKALGKEIILDEGTF